VSNGLLAIVALAQAASILVVLGVLIASHWLGRRRDRRRSLEAHRADEVARLVSAGLMGVERAAVAFDALHLDSLTHLLRRSSFQGIGIEGDRVAAALQRTRWHRRLQAETRSRFWWRRLRAAHALTLGGDAAAGVRPGADHAHADHPGGARRGMSPRPSFTGLRGHALVILAGSMVLVGGGRGPDSLSAQQGCARDQGGVIEAGWNLYRTGEIEAARVRFEQVLGCEPESVSARIGLGYAALRQMRYPEARTLFRGILAGNPDHVDALLGLGLLAWRTGERDSARVFSQRVLRLDRNNSEAQGLLARVREAPAPGRRPVERPDWIRPDTVEYPARTSGDRFEVRTAGGWKPFYVNGVNLGAALPGKHPSQFPDSATYAGWIAEMAAMGANTVRLYTIHPPDFYRALRQHNVSDPERALWLIHGVWTELPPGNDYLDPRWEAGFFSEMRRVVDVLHGRADLKHRPGHASGAYTANVSDWTLAFIIGREWEPHSVVAFNQRRPGFTEWSGRYLQLGAGTPMDAWLAKACEEIIAYEMATYSAQRPVAYTNWPTLDPLEHPTETTVDEEMRIRAGLGERVEVRPREYDNDAASLSAFLVEATAEFPAGHFASYHAYPYYPDFMVLDPEYGKAVSPSGASNYYGYLRDLKRLHAGMPVLIAEYGVPASVGAAHLQPQGWHHGGHTEVAMANIDERLTRDIAAAGMAGGILFAWIDEWFKKNWIAIDFEIPLDRNRLWLNRLDAEQQYGIFAMDPGSGPGGETVRERLGSWDGVQPLLEGVGGSLKAVADEAYLWLLYQGRGAMPSSSSTRELMIGFDMVDPASGDFRWPDRQGEPLSVGVEFVLRLSPREAQLLVDPPYNPFRLQPVRDSIDSPTRSPPLWPTRESDARPAGSVPQGLFAGRLEQRYAHPYQPVTNSDGRYDSLRVITNRPRFTRGSDEYLAIGYDRGILPAGPLPDGLWEWLPERDAVEIRIPWTLLNVTDPSQRRVLYDPYPAGRSHRPPPEGYRAIKVPDIGLVAATLEPDGGWTALSPAERTDRSDGVARFSWPTWEVPRWQARRRPVFEAMRRTFGDLTPAVVQNPSVGRPAGEGAGGGAR
jgi:tetratricopeptide (TPR) repeat protein